LEVKLHFKNIAVLIEISQQSDGNFQEFRWRRKWIHFY